MSIAELFFFFLPQNCFSKHVVALKNDYITPKSLLILPKKLMIHNAKISYHQLVLKNPSNAKFACLLMAKIVLLSSVL